jgi:hypothetical protein
VKDVGKRSEEEEKWKKIREQDLRTSLNAKEPVNKLQPWEPGMGFDESATLWT